MRELTAAAALEVVHELDPYVHGPARAGERDDRRSRRDVDRDGWNDHQLPKFLAVRQPRFPAADDGSRFNAHAGHSVTRNRGRLRLRGRTMHRITTANAETAERAEKSGLCGFRVFCVDRRVTPDRVPRLPNRRALEIWARERRVLGHDERQRRPKGPICAQLQVASGDSKRLPARRRNELQTDVLEVDRATIGERDVDGHSLAGNDRPRHRRSGLKVDAERRVDRVLKLLFLDLQDEQRVGFRAQPRDCRPGRGQTARERGHARRRVLHREPAHGAAHLIGDRREQRAGRRWRGPAERGEQTRDRDVDTVEKACLHSPAEAGHHWSSGSNIRIGRVCL